MTMQKGKEDHSFYITTSIAYVNAPPHIGYAFELVLGDVIARWRRLSGDNVYFLTGTDEHGAKIARAAEAAGMTPQKFVDKNALRFRELAEKLNISHSDFIRTSDRVRHWPGAVKMWKALEAAGAIEKRSYKGLYCVGHEAFVTQKDLVNGKCADHASAPEVVEEENYFFLLSRYSARIREAIASGALKIFPEHRTHELLNFIDQGLEDVSFSRPAKDIPWGIPVPGDLSQNIYVWCDALTNYISALGYGSEDESLFKKWWPADVQVIGKDITRFHALIWTGMLMAAGFPLPKALLVHGFITSGGKKMSKTLGNVIDPFALVQEYGVDPMRFYLIHGISSFEDGDFTQERFEEMYEAYFVSGIGNYVSRVARMATEYFNGQITEPSGELLGTVQFLEGMKNEEGEVLGCGDAKTTESVFHYRSIYERGMLQFDFREALGTPFWGFLKQLDRYIENYEPYKLIKEHKDKTGAVLWNLCYGMASIAQRLIPFLPDTAQKIFDVLGVKPDMKRAWKQFFVTMPEQPLFPRK